MGSPAIDYAALAQQARGGVDYAALAAQARGQSSPAQPRPAGLPAGVTLAGLPGPDAPVNMDKQVPVARAAAIQAHPFTGGFDFDTRTVPNDGSETDGSKVRAHIQNVLGPAAATALSPIRHPLDTIKGIGKMIVNPGGAGREMGDAVVQDFTQNGPVAGAEHLAGQVGGMYLGGEAARPLLRVGAAAAGIPKEILTHNVDTPIAGSGGMSPRARYEAMQRVGVTPNAADATNNPVLQMIRKGNEGSVAGSHIYENLHGKNLDALTKATNDTLGTMSPLDPEGGGQLIQSRLQKPFVRLQNQAHDTLNAMSPLEGEAAGSRLQSLLKANQEELHTTGGQQEQAIREAYGDQPIASYDPMRSTARSILGKNAAVDALVPGLAQKQTAGILRNISQFGEAPEGVTPLPRPTVGNLLDIRSRLLDVNANNPELVRGAAAADIDQQIGATHNTIGNTIPPEGKEAWEKANSTWRDMKDTYDDPSSPFYHAVRTTNPSSLVEGIGAPTPEAVRALRTRAGDEGVGIVGRGVAAKTLGRTATGEYNIPNFGGNLERLPAEYRDQLFGPQHEPLQKIAAQSRDIEPYRKAAFDTPPEKLVQGIGAPTGSEFRDLAPRIGAEGVGAIQRGVTDKLLRTDLHSQFNFPTFGRQLANLPADYKGALFGESPGGTQRLNDVATAANTLDFNPNRSGTANHLQKKAELAGLLSAPGAGASAAVTGHPVIASGLIAGPIAYNAAQYGIARLMNSPAVVDWLMKKPAAPTPIPPSVRAIAPLLFAPKRGQ